MPEKEDFSWEKGKVKEDSTLGKITIIPVGEGVKLKPEEQENIVVDEFKEKMAEILSKELHKKDSDR